MKNLILFASLASILLPLSSFAGNDPDNVKPKHEFSFAYQIPSANSINVNYALSISEKNSLKFGLNLGSYYYDYQPQNNTVYPVTKFSVSPQILLGFEHRKTMKSNFEFISGVNLRLNPDYLFSKVENPTWPINLQKTTSWDFGFGVGATFGFYYKVSDNFLIGSSINPSIIYEDGNETSYDVKKINFNVTNISVVDLRYRF
jgi:long-subunit fatty acid transport protein